MPRALLDGLAAHRLDRARALALGALRRLASHYDASAWLDAYRLVLLDTAGWRVLVGDARLGSLLDVGAGTGDVHVELARLFERAVATEISKGAIQRARARGIRAVEIDLAREPWPLRERFDVVSLLNVLDRTDRPLSLLDRCVSLLAEEGRLVVAVPLPLRAHVERPGGTADPDEWLGVEGSDFDAALASLVERVLAPRNLEVVRWTRAIYASSGDPRRPRYDLDAAILCCARAT